MLVVRCGHFLARAGLHGVAQGAFHFIQFGFVFGAQIDFHGGARGNRIHGGAAFDHSEIVGTARHRRAQASRKISRCRAKAR